ncbi:MAG: hypothetical protein INR73_17395 [Williamsia sp.]|nr:hypothetical protein [Williamsia sp.]
MTKNLYYRQTFKRENVLENWIVHTVGVLASYPRLLIEVFIRKDFGERYFRLSSAFTVASFLAIWPYIPKVWRFLTARSAAYAVIHARYNDDFSVMPDYLLWYLYLALFVVFSLKRHREIKRNPSVFDFAKFSLFNGTINPFFFSIRLPGKKTDVRRVETLLEPLPFFIAGLLLWLLSQKLGVLLMVCSVFYSLSYVSAYRGSDNFIMDKIDQIILNEEMEKVFMDDAPEEESRYVRFSGRKPDDPEVRRKILSQIMAEEEAIEAR